MNKRILLVIFLLFFSAASSMALSETRVACVGDSITAGWKLKEADKYVTKLGGLLGPGYDIQNFGHSAYCMLEISDKSYWYSPMFEAAKAFEPDIVTIMLGTNDAHPNYWPQYEDQYRLDYLRMIKEFQELSTKPRVIVLGLPYLKEGGRYDGVVALDALLPGIALEAGVEFVEIWDELVDSGLSSNQLMKDPIHPSAAAHTIIAETIYPVIVSNLCGDDFCNPGENSCKCADDCGSPPLSESEPALGYCSNLIDDDCDGNVDCHDSDCSDEPDCQSACNEDGICQPGEDCNNCANDCDSKRTGKPSSRYCCGNGIQEEPENLTLCDGNL